MICYGCSQYVVRLRGGISRVMYGCCGRVCWYVAYGCVNVVAYSYAQRHRNDDVMSGKMLCCDNHDVRVAA